jgi:hypothetical protein
MLSKFLPTIIALFALAACATPTSMRGGGKPDFDAMSDKDPQKMAGCISDRFEEADVGFTGVRFSTRPTSLGYSISGDKAGPLLFGGADTILLVDVAKSDNKTRVQLFTHILMGEEKWIALVRACI